METIMSETALLQQYRSFPEEIQLAVSSYIEFLSEKYNKKIGKNIENKTNRKFGIGKGIIKYMAPDFDEALEDLSDKMF
jgi:hypothetical protein